MKYIRFITSGFLLASCCLVFADAALACSRKGGLPTLEENVGAADEVFVAHLTEVMEKKAPAAWGMGSEMYLEGRYRLVESLKGTTSKQGYVNDVVYGPGNCGLGLMVGWDYVFFIQHSKEVPTARFVDILSGSFPLPAFGVGNPGNEEIEKIRKLIATAPKANRQ